MPAPSTSSGCPPIAGSPWWNCQRKSCPKLPPRARSTRPWPGGRGHPRQAAPSALLAALCVEGRMRSSEELAQLVGTWGRAPPSIWSFSSAAPTACTLHQGGGPGQAVHVPMTFPTIWPVSCCWSRSTGPSRSGRAPATTSDPQTVKAGPGRFLSRCTPRLRPLKSNCSAGNFRPAVVHLLQR